MYGHWKNILCPLLTLLFWTPCFGLFQGIEIPFFFINLIKFYHIIYFSLISDFEMRQLYLVENLLDYKISFWA